MNKWNVVLKLIKYGFPVADKLSDYSDMSADEIYSELETLLNHTFVNIDGDISTYSLDYKIDELLENLNEGQAIGLPYIQFVRRQHFAGQPFFASARFLRTGNPLSAPLRNGSLQSAQEEDPEYQSR